MQFAAFGNLHGDALAQNIAHALCKRRTHITAIAQKALHLTQFRLTTFQCLQGTQTADKPQPPRKRGADVFRPLPFASTG